jgi:predicted nucleic acid-binding protein
VPVVDASVVVDWVAPDVDPATPAGVLLGRLAADQEELIAPRLLLEEVSNALLTGIRRGRWTGALADRAQDLLRRLPIRLVDEPRDLERAWDLARRYDAHPFYDMLYVALAERRETQLITADKALRDLLPGFEWIVTPGDLVPVTDGQEPPTPPS